MDTSEATASGNPIIVTFVKSGNDYEIDSNGIIKESTPKDPSVTLKVAEHKNEKFSTNTELEDNFGNKISVPVGFKITSDSPDNVTEGIIIEDVDAGTTATAGSQFVWIPVGTIYTNQNRTESKKITLGRYDFDSNGIPNKFLTVETVRNLYTIPLEYKDSFDAMYGEGAYDELTSLSDKDDATIQAWIDAGGNLEKDLESMVIPYKEEEIAREGNSTQNATAKNLNDFLIKASKGYYIGRYEAEKDSNGNLTEKATDSIYNNVNQIQASSLARNMYTSSYFDSDLMNSYAWDTAIVFIQSFSEISTYSRYCNKYAPPKGSDKVCNIYDMAGDYLEWSTETCTNR